MIRVNDLGVERAYSLGGLIGRHGVWQVHAHKRDIDILEGAHLRSAFRVAGKIESLAAVRDDVAIAAAFVVKKFSGLGTTLEVVHGYGLNGERAHGFRLAITDPGGVLDGLGYRWGPQEHASGLCNLGQHLRV